MFLIQLLALSSFIFGQESFSIYRVDANNQTAVIQTPDADKVRVGDLYKIETPEGICHTPVSEVVEGFFYVNTEQCRNEDVQKGIPLVSARKTSGVLVAQTDAPATPSSFQQNAMGSNTTDSDSLLQSEFVQNYLAKKLSLYVGYHAGNTLEGKIPVSGQNSINEVSGSNTIGFGAEYKIADMPYNLSAIGGFSYNLPRAYGRYIMEGTSTTQKFDDNPELQLWSFYLNLRYRFLKEAYFFMGINRLLANMSNLPGQTDGDWGFHTGARYYPKEHFFVEGAVNFYNLNYRFQGATTDVSLTELEIKGGYTF